MSTPETPVKSDFRTRAKTNDVAVARLIGFEAKEIADGRATVVLEAGPQHANPMGTLHGGIRQRKLFRKNGGDDETRTRDLCRDNAHG